VATFCLTERGNSAHLLEAAGVEVFSAPQISNRKSSALRYPAHVALASGTLYRLARRWRPSIAHFYLPGPYVIGAPVAMAARVPIKIMSRRSLASYQRSWPTVARFERMLHRKMDMVVGNSRAVVSELRTEGIPDAKLRLIYNGIKTPVLQPKREEARQALGLGPEDLVGVVVANLIRYKGHHELIKGVAHAAAHIRQPLRILLAGRDQGLGPELRALAKQQGVGDIVEFLGQRSDVAPLFAAADFGLLTSREEGFSNVVLEGMAAGLPMIVTAVGGNPEAVLDGETGIVVPSRNSTAIGDAILRLVLDPDLRKRLGEAGQKRVSEEFSIEHCVTAHAELYQEMLAKRQAKDAAT
jgi:glycosyltransferase involved in cell wall biosynthesis